MSTASESNDPASALDALVGKTLGLLAGTAAQEQPGPFTGIAADGLIRCEVGADGRVRSVEVDPRALRLPAEDLGQHLVSAINEALDARPGRPDTGPLLDELRAVQEQSVVEMRRITQAFTEALNQSVAGRS